MHGCRRRTRPPQTPRRRLSWLPQRRRSERPSRVRAGQATTPAQATTPPGVPAVKSLLCLAAVVQRNRGSSWVIRAGTMCCRRPAYRYVTRTGCICSSHVMAAPCSIACDCSSPYCVSPVGVCEQLYKGTQRLEPAQPSFSSLTHLPSLFRLRYMYTHPAHGRASVPALSHASWHGMAAHFLVTLPSYSYNKHMSLGCPISSHVGVRKWMCFYVGSRKFVLDARVVQCPS